MSVLSKAAAEGGGADPISVSGAPTRFHPALLVLVVLPEL